MGIVDRENKVRTHGSYGHQPLVTLIENDPSVGFGSDTALTIAGAPLGPQYIYGSFRGKESGKLYRSMRTFVGEVAGYIFLLEAEEGQDHVPIKAAANLYRGMIDVGEKDGSWGYWRPNDRSPASFMSNKTSASWTEGDLIDVVGTPIPNPTQFCIPDARNPLVYTNRSFLCNEGTVNGEPVDGIFNHDIMHLRPGQGWFHTRYYREIEGVWCVFITEFEDGNIHYGELVWGQENFSLAVITRTDGETIIATDIDVEVDLDEDGYAKLIQWHVLPGETWEWQSIGTRFPKTPIEGPRWGEGVVRRQGDGRTWVKTDAYLDCFPERVRHTSARNSR
jgi:hypothetical protein